jgi:asparagine synthase (glutamine-hydrolysing)
MCGVAGIFSLGAPLGDAEEAAARGMSALLAHRGPDGRGLHRDPDCILAHTRLNIQDFSEMSAQPMSSRDGSVWISYNGEATNFRELRERFGLDSGGGLRSRTDTEVLLRLYETQGIGFLRHLTGMFAFCLFDKKARKAYLVRDFFGLRPMFYMIKGGRVYFASEIKALLSLDCFSSGLDYDGIRHFFSLGYIPGRRTPFEAVRELDGGALLEIDFAAGRHDLREYHSLRYAPDAALTEREAVPLVRAAMLKSVERSLISDAPVGMTVSGGVDTSSLLVLARELGASAGMHTFSLRMSDPSFDESRYQRIITAAVPTIHHEVVVTPEAVLEQLVRHVAFLDEPSGDGAAIPCFLLAREARKHVPSLISGEGGDEVFNAYETYRACVARRLYRRWVPSAARGALRALADALPVSHDKLSFDFLAKRFTAGAELGVAQAHAHWRQALGEEEKDALMPDHPGSSSTADLFDELYRGLDFEEDLDRLAWIDLKQYFIRDLMVKNDRMMMAHSVETRFPYMDRELVELACRIPAGLKIKGFEGRYIQKQAMKGLLPPQIWRRKNMGLEMPHSRWFLGPFRAVAERYFSKKNVGKTGFLSPAAVDALWREHLSGTRDNGRALWCLLTFLIWFDLFVYEKNFKEYL